MFDSLTDEQRFVYSDLHFRAMQFMLHAHQQHEKGLTTPMSKEDALKKVASLARQWAESVDPSEKEENK